MLYTLACRTFAQSWFDLQFVLQPNKKDSLSLVSRPSEAYLNLWFMRKSTDNIFFPKLTQIRLKSSPSKEAFKSWKYEYLWYRNITFFTGNWLLYAKFVVHGIAAIHCFYKGWVFSKLDITSHSEKKKKNPHTRKENQQEQTPLIPVKNLLTICLNLL